MKEIDYATSAVKELLAITQLDRTRIVAKLKQYARDPAGLRNQVKALKGIKAFRLRIGDYRIIFSEDQTRLLVLKIGHRRDVYD